MTNDAGQTNPPRDLDFAQAQLAGDTTSLAAVRSKAEKTALALYAKKTLVVIVAG